MREEEGFLEKARVYHKVPHKQPLPEAEREHPLRPPYKREPKSALQNFLLEDAEDE